MARDQEQDASHFNSSEMLTGINSDLEHLVGLLLAENLGAPLVRAGEKTDRNERVGIYLPVDDESKEFVFIGIDGSAGYAPLNDWNEGVLAVYKRQYGNLGEGALYSIEGKRPLVAIAFNDRSHFSSYVLYEDDSATFLSKLDQALQHAGELKRQRAEKRAETLPKIISKLQNFTNPEPTSSDTPGD